MDRIRELRKERSLSQAKLAVMADMDPATLNRLEQGKGNPNLRTLERVAEALDVEVIDLLGKAQRRSSLEPSLFNGVLEDERRVDATIRESEHIKGYVSKCLERWGRVARGEDPHLAPDHAYSIEVSQHVISLTELLGKLLRVMKAELPTEAAISEQRDIVRLIDRMSAVSAEIGTIANVADEGITAEAVDEEGQALVDATAKAIIANQNPSDRLAKQRAENTRKHFIALTEAQQRRAAEVKRLAAGE